MYLFEDIIASTCGSSKKVRQDQGTNYYTPTRVDFTKTYHSPPKIHRLSIESVDFGWSPHGVYMESTETPRGLHGLYEESTWTP